MPRPIGIEFEGKHYRSQRELVADFGIDLTTFLWRRKHGQSMRAALGLDPLVSFDTFKAVDFEGKHYRSQGELLTSFGIKLQTFLERRKRGLTLRQALGLDADTSDCIVFEGVFYKTHYDIAKTFGVSLNTFRGRLQRGLSLREALGLDIINPVEFEGKLFRSQTELLRSFEVSKNTFWRRRKYGFSMRQALGFDPIKRPRVSWSKNGPLNEIGKIVIYDCYLLYEIVNLLSGKSYVGITIQSLASRYTQHLSAVKSNQNYPLYNAMRKYGLENFEIRLIRNDACSGAELQQQEIDEIARRDSTNSLKGYNLHPGGSPGNGKSIQIGLNTFSSHAEAAHYFGIPPYLFYSRINHFKWTPEQSAEIEIHHNIKRHDVVLHGQTMTLKKAAEQIGVSYPLAHGRVSNGYSYEQALGIVPMPAKRSCVRRSVVVFGKNYSTMKECAKAFDVCNGSFCLRLRQGQDAETAISQLLASPRKRRKSNEINNNIMES